MKNKIKIFILGLTLFSISQYAMSQEQEPDYILLDPIEIRCYPFGFGLHFCATETPYDTYWSIQ